MRGRTALVTGAWLLICGGIALLLGAGLYGVAASALDALAQRPADWPGWALLFDALIIGLPAVAMLIALALGLRGRLPGLTADRQQSRDA